MLPLRYSSLINRHGHRDTAVINQHLLWWHGTRTGLIRDQRCLKAPTFLPTSFPGSNFHLFSQNLPKIDGI
jgi:hypothetical protein